MNVCKERLVELMGGIAEEIFRIVKRSDQTKEEVSGQPMDP